MMQNLRFPLNFTFKIFTPSNDFTVFDAQGEEVAYTRQRIFKIKESIEIFRNGSRNERLYTIDADRIIDFNANYTVRDAAGSPRYTLHEANPWIAVADGILGEIPVLGMLTGYFLNPTYTIAAPDGRETYRLKKNASFFERKFSLEKTAQAPAEDDVLVLNAAMLLMLLERGDG